MMSGLTLEIFNDGKKAGREEGIQQGMQAERIKIFDSLVKEGILTREEADKRITNVN